MKVRYSETALSELDEIFAYIHEHNPSAAAAVVDRIERLASLIGEIPFIGQRTDEEDVLDAGCAISFSDLLCGERKSRGSHHLACSARRTASSKRGRGLTSRGAMGRGVKRRPLVLPKRKRVSQRALHP
jgi:hypothetical protein